MVWRSTCGVTFFLSSEGQVLEAVTIWFARTYRTPSPLRRLPRALGKSISVWALWGSFNQFFNTALVCLVSGVHLSFRPFPVQRTMSACIDHDILSLQARQFR